MLRTPVLVSVLTALLMPPRPVPGDQSSSGDLVFPAGLDLVKLTLTVRDEKGGLVSDLKPEDFVVFEDGRPQAVQVFARAFDPGQDETLALDVGLLMDTSESMIEQLRLSQEAALRFLEAVPRARDLLTIFFDQDIRISRYDSEHQQGLAARILETRGSGYTALYDAIVVYLSRVQDTPGRKVLVLFTDGEDTTSRTGISELVSMVQSSSVIIYAIDFSRGFGEGTMRAAAARSFLRQMADITGGGIFRPLASKDLPGIYQKILEELSSQYVLGYSSDRKADGKFRHLRVELSRSGLRVRHRQGYTAPR